MTLELKVRGPFAGPSGYDHHVREFTRELVRQGAKVELVEFAEWGPVRLPHHLRDPWFETLAAPSRGKIVLHFCLPDQVEEESGRINVNFTMFEATRIHLSWVDRAKQHDLIILPTESSRDAWVASGVPASKIQLCPLGVGGGFLRNGVPPLDLKDRGGRRIADYSVRFLNVSELGPRKNLKGLLKAWLRGTRPDDDAVLMVKAGSYTPGSLRYFRNEFPEIERRAGRKMTEAAPVHFIHDVFPDADMPRLFASATHYLSMSFGEGWDLSMIEAAATGLKLIAPDHSAYRAYLDASIASLIPSREVPADFGDGTAEGTLFVGANWWQPDEDAAIDYIRRAIEGRAEDKESPKQRIREQFTWEKATRRLIEILSEAESPSC